MRAGLLRTRLTLQKPVRTADGQGGFTLDWQDVDTVWARVTPLSGREQMLAEQLSTGLTHQVSMRYYSGVLPTWRGVTDDGAILNIRSVSNPDSKRREHQLYCEQIIPSVD